MSVYVIQLYSDPNGLLQNVSLVDMMNWKKGRIIFLFTLVVYIFMSIVRIDS